ncbi:MAG: nucleoside phosphorylase [Bacteroidales bacterium]|nr:nucleoside phosphorylase [Bacteroidales bacterium]
MGTNIRESELVLSPQGSLYHIGLTGDTLADDVILVGDPGRVAMLREMFDSVEHESSNREMNAVTGICHGHRFTVLSTGMGCDNIDIVMTELDAAANFDLATRTQNTELRHLRIVRIGTCGSLQPNVQCGSFVASRYVVGLDGLMNYYDCEESHFEQTMNDAIIDHLGIDVPFAKPYSVCCSKVLMDGIGYDMQQVITATAPGFYGPQGRRVRIAPKLAGLNERLSSFEWEGLRLTNLEMETSAIYGFAKAMGHEALTVCLVVANRPTGRFINAYHNEMRSLVATVLERFAKI